MILVSVLLVAAAFGLLIAGSSLFFAEILLVYVSIGTSLLAAVFLGVAAFRRRGELAGSAPAEAPGSSASPAGAGAAQGSADSGVAASAGSAAPTPTATTSPEARTAAVPTAPTAGEVPGDARVLAVPARHTYHTENCRQLRAREHHELSYTDAREQGYTACRSCMPDSVLAARGSSGGASEEATGE